MMDKWGFMHQASQGSDGAFWLDKKPVTHLGPGRPLGFHHDKDGNVIIANAGHVRSWVL